MKNNYNNYYQWRKICSTGLLVSIFCNCQNAPPWMFPWKMKWMTERATSNSNYEKPRWVTRPHLPKLSHWIELCSTENTFSWSTAYYMNNLAHSLPGFPHTVWNWEIGWDQELFHGTHRRLCEISWRIQIWCRLNPKKRNLACKPDFMKFY